MTLDEAIEQVRRMDIERCKGRHIENDSLPAILAAMMQAKARMTGSSSTYGDLPETISRQIVSHEWDNKTPCEQRDWLITQLASAEKVVEAAKDICDNPRVMAIIERYAPPVAPRINTAIAQHKNKEAK